MLITLTCGLNPMLVQTLWIQYGRSIIYLQLGWFVFMVVILLVAGYNIGFALVLLRILIIVGWLYTIDCSIIIIFIMIFAVTGSLLWILLAIIAGLVVGGTMLHLLIIINRNFLVDLSMRSDFLSFGSRLFTFLLPAVQGWHWLVRIIYIIIKLSYVLHNVLLLLPSSMLFIVFLIFIWSTYS